MTWSPDRARAVAPYPPNTRPSQGALGQLIDVPLGDLVAGDNTLELTTTSVPQGYPAGVVNVDLIVKGAD